MKMMYKVIAVIMVVLTLPFVINLLILQPNYFETIGDGTHWLSFWGSYLGAIISAAVAFVILNRQIKQNRSIIQKQLESQRVDEFRKAFVDYMSATNCNLLVTPINELFTSTESTFNLTKNIIDNEYHSFMKLKILQDRKEDCDILFEDLTGWRNYFTDAVTNLHITSRKIIDSRFNNTNLRTDIEKEPKYQGEFMRKMIMTIPADDNTLKSYEKRISEVHKKEREAIVPLQKKVFEIMHGYVLDKDEEIKKL